jgi:hypothetical protein
MTADDWDHVDNILTGIGWFIFIMVILFGWPWARKGDD